MEPNAFVKEVYRRMSLRHATDHPHPSWAEMKGQSQVLQSMHEMQHLLPQDKNSAILDLGFGSGWFLAACLNLGYTNLAGADFGIAHKSYVRDWRPEAIQLFEILHVNAAGLLRQHMAAGMESRIDRRRGFRRLHAAQR